MSALRKPLLAVLLGALLSVGSVALAWDTKEFKHEGETEPYENWRSLWLCDTSVNIGRGTDCSRNEHEWLADRALNLVVSGNNPWAIASPTDLYVIDLSNSYFRPDLVEGDSPWSYQRRSSEWGGPLEERDLASPPHFAGIADFTYTIYDWINKNRLCPAIASGDLLHCHNYSVWMGAGFNSSHFGSQATLSYRTLHQTALWAAGQANSLRNALEGQSQATQAVFYDNIREAELMALAYEGAAQHFLQDRWSTGHMWERWSGPDHAQNPYSNDIGQSAMIGAVTGVIHGSEAVLHQPAMLSSPMPSIGLLGRNGVNPAAWRGSSDTELFAGVGDYRAEDMFDNYIGSEYALYANTDWPLDVRSQRNRMMQCSASSYRQVIEAFGTNATEGGYGVQGVRLSSYASGGMDAGCFDTWATNRSIYQAWNLLNASTTLTANGLPLFVRSQLATNAHIRESEVSQNISIDRAALSRIGSRIYWNGIFRGDGIELATGGMGDYGRAHPGAYYNAPNYLEPMNLGSLPVEDPRGRDRNTVFGFFNRANAGEYCSGAAQRFERLRVQIRSADTPEERERYRGVCRYLAQRIFAETRTDYRGPMRSYQVSPAINAGARNPDQITPVCAWQPVGAITTGPNDDTLPYYLHQGYVPFNFSTNQPNNASWSDTYGQWGYGQHSVAHWCDMTPVINTVEDEGDAARDIVAVMVDADRRVNLYGMNFGAGRGRVFIGRSWTDAVEVEEGSIERWFDDTISFVPGEQAADFNFDEHDEAYILIQKEAVGDGSPVPGYRSVGRFVLLNEIPRPKIVSMRVSRGDENFMTYEAPEPPEDPGPRGTPAPDPELGAFRPVTPGEVRIEIEFDMAIAVDEEETRFALNQIDIENGEWSNGNRRWRGTLDIPDGDEFASDYRGVQPIVVNVRAEEGSWIDGDPSSAGLQPDATNLVLVDTIPVHVQRFRVSDGRRSVYSAQWSGGPDLSEEENLTTQGLGDPERMLRVETARAAPATGEGRIRLDLSAEVENAPVVQVGGSTATMTMANRGDRWEGTFDFEQAANGAVDGDLPVSISLTDASGKGLDADPRSVVQILPLGSDYYNLWARYEAARGDANTSQQGGTDTWHRIGEPPALSMVIVLDASGSMGESSRMENAKAGIGQTLDNLPTDQRIELAGVIFHNCGSISHSGFTRDIQQVRNYLMGASPSGGTPLADAHIYARDLLSGSANPGAPDWRYVTFTDGAETCDGNVAAATQDLEQLLRDHRNLQQGGEPEEPDEEEVAREALPDVNCTPLSWRGYQVAVDDRGSGLDEISMEEHWYIERALPDGRCFARLETKTYFVHYGSIRNTSGGPARSDWDINSRASEEVSDFGTSRLGATDLDRVRNAGRAARGASVSLPDARSQIAAAVAAALAEQEDS